MSFEEADARAEKYLEERAAAEEAAKAGETATATAPKTSDGEDDAPEPQKDSVTKTDGDDVGTDSDTTDDDTGSTPEEPSNKTRVVKSGDTEKMYTEAELIEKGIKAIGLDAHYTRKGQQLAEFKRQLDERSAELENKTFDIQAQLDGALQRRDDARAEYQQMLEENRKLDELREVDPDAYKQAVANKNIQKELRELKAEVKKAEQFREDLLKQREIDAQRDLIDEIAMYAEKYDVTQSSILGQMYVDGNKGSVEDAAKVVRADIDERIKKMAKKDTNTDNATDDGKPGSVKQSKKLAPRIASNQGGTPVEGAEKPKMPSLMDDTEKFNEAVIAHLDAIKRSRGGG